jgi:hypothetical protein
MPKPNDAAPKGRPSDDEIAKRAYELYLQRGSLPGYEIDDWLQAEAELTASASRTESAADETQPTETTAEAASGRRSGGRRDAASSGSRRSLRQ